MKRVSNIRVMSYSYPMRMLSVVFFMLLQSAIVIFPSTGGAQEACSQAYIIKREVNLRSAPDIKSGPVRLLERNQTVLRLEDTKQWVRIARPDGAVGWVRNDMISNTVVRILSQERVLRVYRDCRHVASMPLAAGLKGLWPGRYFMMMDSGRFVLSWPNRQDLRKLLLAGKVSHAQYEQGVLNKSDVFGEPPAICSGKSPNPRCVATLSSKDFKQLAAILPQGSRVEIYADGENERQLNIPDAMSRAVFLGAMKQLEYPAAGVEPGGRVPMLGYPGGDIQPDFASSTDIVIRAVREAGLDLQAAVYEDMLRHPGRYSGMDMGQNDYGAHRLVPVLHVFFTHNTLSLPTDYREHPFSFEPGDIVFFDTDDRQGADRVGVVVDRFNRAGYPYVVTVWGMGQYAAEMNLLGRKNLEVVGHFRFVHLFEYQ